VTLKDVEVRHHKMLLTIRVIIHVSSNTLFIGNHTAPDVLRKLF